MPYNPDLQPNKNLDSLEWGVWVFRTVTGNISGDSALTDTQVNMYMDLSSYTIDNQVYYRPFEAAARWLESSGTNYKTISIGMTSISKFDNERVKSLRLQQADLDTELPKADVTETNQSRVKVAWFEL